MREPALFQGSPFIRWTLGPAVLVTACTLPIFVPRWTPTSVAVLAWLEALFVSFLLVLLSPTRFRWAGRVAAGLVAVGYTAYLGHELWNHPESLWPPGRRSAASAFNALVGLIVFGTPCGTYALLGRWPFGSSHSAKELPIDVTSVSFDADSVSLRRPDGLAEMIAWSELQSVDIVTTTEGPFVEDAYIVLAGASATLSIPQGAQGTSELLEHLQSLPGFDSSTVVSAMSCTDDARFNCWKRETA